MRNFQSKFLRKFFTFVTFKIVKNWPFFKQKVSRAGAHGKKIECALAPALGRYCETGGAHEVRPGRGRKGRPRKRPFEGALKPWFLWFMSVYELMSNLEVQNKLQAEIDVINDIYQIFIKKLDKRTLIKNIIISIKRL